MKIAIIILALLWLILSVLTGIYAPSEKDDLK